MRIGYLSSFPPIESGIATYTSYLESATATHDVETFVVAPHGSQGNNVFPTYTSGTGDFAPAVYQMLTQLTPDLVHIQHDREQYGPSWGMEVVDLVLRLRLVDVPVVITLHDIYESLNPAEHLVLRHLLAECSGIIVHEAFQRETLERELGPEIGAKVTVLDHGVREVKPVRDAKRKLGLNPADNVVLMCGYFRPSKGFHKAIEFFGDVVEAHPDTVLVLAGKSRTIEFDQYRRDLLDQIEDAPFANRVQILSGQFPQHTFDTLLSAADVVCLPYDEGAQSGVLSQAIAFRRPLVTSQLKAFTSVTRRSGAGVSCLEDDYAGAINRVLSSNALANSFSAAADTYIRRRAGWSVIARRHLELYQSVISDGAGSGRYVHVPGRTEPVNKPVGELADSRFGNVGIDDWLKIAKNYDPASGSSQQAVTSSPGAATDRVATTAIVK